ncbi:MAG TPA: hypothetical protein VEU62_22275 [Bryobacterales bacterium]|nr:hypothetical protein [Bryobacterales bacterium]
MAKEEKPLEYERRILDTKGVAQRLDLNYFRRRYPFRFWRRQLTWLAPLAAAVAIAPFLTGIGGGKRIFSNGPVSRAHAVFEKDCALCHAASFSEVADASCKKCHDGPLHQANAIGSERCAACHIEHRGNQRLADVNERHCTRCHGDLAAHGRDVRITAVRITAFRPEEHPEFSAAKEADRRPLQLNHAIHMPAQPKTIRGMKLPMKCSDCHVTDLNSPRGDLLPVTFEQNCRSCHKRELEFDVYQLLGENAPPAPHTKDPQTIHAFILESYQKLLEANPEVARRPLGRELTPPANAAAWLATVVKDSESFLFEKKCIYCHEYEGARDGFPVVKKVNLIRGEYVQAKPEGKPWVAHAQFSHRAHRAVECSSCHTAARTSTKTSDVLIPRMQSCLPCHGASGTALDRCAQCHLYHDKSKELDRDRRPVEQLMGRLFQPAGEGGL